MTLLLPNTGGSSPEDFDFFVCVRNSTTNSLRFFEEWNSWGFENLKFACHNGWHEYWIAKRPGSWPRNFPSSQAIAPSQAFLIPVALNTNVWEGLSEAMADKKATHIRALYEQIVTPTNDPPFMTDQHWNGSQSSRYYGIDQVIGITDKREKNSNNRIQAISAGAEKPDS